MRRQRPAVYPRTRVETTRFDCVKGRNPRRVTRRLKNFPRECSLAGAAANSASGSLSRHDGSRCNHGDSDCATRDLDSHRSENCEKMFRRRDVFAYISARPIRSRIILVGKLGSGLIRWNPIERTRRESAIIIYWRTVNASCFSKISARYVARARASSRSDCSDADELRAFALSAARGQALSMNFCGPPNGIQRYFPKYFLSITRRDRRCSVI